MSCLDKLNDQFPIRNLPEQKKAFRLYAMEEIQKSGYDAKEEDNDGHINLVIGDPEKAKVVFTAHYDTPRRSVMPNLLMPKHKILHFFYMFSVILPILIISMFVGYLVMRSLGGPQIIPARIAGVGVYLAIYAALCFLAFKGPVNIHNKNDNTSGTAAVFDLIQKIGKNDNVAYILFDDEEKGKKGSKAFAAAHTKLKEDLLVVNMDCVGNGNTFIAGVPDLAKNDSVYPLLETALKELGVLILSREETAMNSDQKSFDKGIGIGACLNKKGFYYTPNLHTAKDTVASGETVDKLTDTLASFVHSMSES